MSNVHRGTTTRRGGPFAAAVCTAASMVAARRRSMAGPAPALVLAPLLAMTVACGAAPGEDGAARATSDSPYAVVLGTAQDGGHPQAGTKPGAAWAPERHRHVVALAVVDPVSDERWLFEATPDFREQLHALDRVAPAEGVPGLDGIFLTHAHVGHYAGLIHLGHEAIGADAVPVWAMPRMREFLRTNGPWDQLVRYGNIEPRPLEDGEPARLNDRVTVTPFRVPHRDEYSETVGFRIEGPERTVVLLPDIDKWERWDEWGVRIEDVIAEADVAYLDGTFYADGEVPGRAMEEIPHPFIVETMRRFEALPAAERAKVRFIHLNRTNPVALPRSDARREVERAGFRVAEALERVGL
ncbi:MAG: MBL fold metallo-hydrolase [Gemmatimonadota bacterium]